MRPHAPFAVLLATLMIVAAPSEALAVIQNLNGATGQDQLFQNDSNVTVTTAPGTNTHTFGWSGLLPVSRGGTGTSSFSAGSLLFSNGFSITENNSSLYWDYLNNRLGIGTSTPTTTLDVLGDVSISGDLVAEVMIAPDAVVNNTNGEDIYVSSGAGFGSGGAGQVILYGGFGGETGPGGSIQLEAGRGGTTSGDGGSVILYGGFGQSQNANAGNVALYGSSGQGSGEGSSVYIYTGHGGTTGNAGYFWLQGGNGGQTSGNGGPLFFRGGSANGNGNGGDIDFAAGQKAGSGRNGVIRFSSTGQAAVFDTSLINVSEKTFTFPNASGTFGLLGVDQTWGGLNKFEASTNSTIYVGSEVKSGCIVLGDSDGAGVTYLTANDGVLTSSTTKPAICQ